jgi:two-component system, OmpR family, phosphate regulon response regulator PhoB
MKRRILVADDDEDVLNLVTGRLLGAGFVVLRSHDGTEALHCARAEHPDLVVLDRMMPGLSGLEVCKALKAETSTASIPIILLTACGAEIDRIIAFEIGADDYITKPFSPRELVLRVQAILRRKFESTPRPNTLQAGDISLNLAEREVTVAGTRVELTPMEFQIIATLVEHRGRVQSREMLLKEIWGIERDIELRTIDTHLRRIREKLGPAASQIHTVRGFGYRMNEH